MAEQAPRERGLFTPAYNLDPAVEADYLKWLHGVHLPRTLAEGSFSAISHCESAGSPEATARLFGFRCVPKRFLLLELMPNYRRLHSLGRLEARKVLPPDVDEMMALRLGQVRNHHAEIDRIEGPAATRREGLALGPVAFLLRFDIAPEAQPDFNAWLEREHWAAAAGIEGLRSARRYLTVQGEPRNLLLYEFETAEAFAAGGLERTWSTPWAGRLIPSLAHGPESNTLYRRIWHQG